MYFVALIFLIVLIYAGFQVAKPKELTEKVPEINIIPMLKEHVSFYRALPPEEQLFFEEEVHEFLFRVQIVGVDTEVTDLDKVLVAASGVIPLFAFRDWFYQNIAVVEVYRDSFNHDFETGPHQQILGMVGGGVMSGRMALSQKALRLGFANDTDKRNTAIHEFVHLLDMADGAVDGIPEILLDKHLVLPWLELIRGELEKVRKDNSDIDDYGGTNQAEFFAVAAEYFFEHPELMKQKHPILFDHMMKAFKREPKLDRQRPELPGRNDACWCGSGLKYKKCHGALHRDG